MAIAIKSSREIEKMREAGKLLATLHEELADYLRPGISTYDIDQKGRRLCNCLHCEPSFLNYNGYPAAICISVNNEVVHGIPSKKRILQEGDLVSLDAGVYYKGYHSDAARTHGIGKISEEAQRLIDVTRQAFFEGIRYAKEEHHLHEISTAIQNYVEGNGFSVVRDLVGHGIGQNLHEAPEVPNFKVKGRGVLLQQGMTLAIEPMVNAGGYAVWWMEDDWTVVTRDGSLSAHYENTILVTDDEPEILSLRQ